MGGRRSSRPSVLGNSSVGSFTLHRPQVWTPWYADRSHHRVIDVEQSAFLRP